MLAAAIQLTAGPDVAANLAAGVAGVREAAVRGATLIVMPEKWLAIGGAEVLRPAAVRLDGLAGSDGGEGAGSDGGTAASVPGPAGPAALEGRDVVGELAALAAELEVDLVAGSLSEWGPAEDERLFNTSVHLRPDGSLGAAYRKVHLFDADVAGRRYRESDAEQPGGSAVVTQLRDPAFQAGLAICFDLRFPEYFAALAAGGANVITLPSAFTERTTRDHWELLVRARAIEIGAFVVAANQCGEHPDGSRTGGQSMIVAPWGEVLARAGERDPGVIVADLDPAAVVRAREALPVRSLRRPDVYAQVPGLAAVPGVPAAGEQNR